MFAIVLWKFRGPPGLQLPKWNSLGGVKVHSLTPSHTPKSMLCDSWLPSWPATLQTLALVTSPRLGLRQNLSRLKLQGKFWQWPKSLLNRLMRRSWRLLKMLRTSLMGRFRWWPRSLPAWVVGEVLTMAEVPFNMLMGWSQQLPRLFSGKNVGEISTMVEIIPGLNYRKVVNVG